MAITNAIAASAVELKAVEKKIIYHIFSTTLKADFTAVC